MNITVGIALSLSGVFAPNGNAMLNASRLFTEIATSSGVIINILSVNDLSTPAGVSAATTSLLSQGVNLFVAPFTAPLTAAQRATIEAAGTPAVVLAPAAVDVSVFANTSASLFLFGLLLPAVHALALGLTTLQQSGARTVLLAAQGLPGALQACAINTSTYGMASSLSAPPFVITANNTNVLLDSISALHPDVVAICAGPPLLNTVLHGAISRGINANAWLIDSDIRDVRIMSDPQLAQAFLFDAVSWAPANPIPLLPADSTCLSYAPYGCITPAQFSTAYEEAFGVPPPQEAAATFGALDVFVQSVFAVGSTDPALLGPFLGSTLFSSSFGLLQFGAKSHVSVGEGFVLQQQPQAAATASSSIQALQLEINGLVVIAPSSASAKTIVFPVPTWQQQSCLRAGGCGGHGTCAASGGCSCDFGYSGSTCSSPTGLALLITGASIAALLFLALLAWALRSRWRAVTAQKLAVVQGAADVRLAAATSAAETRRNFLRWVLCKCGTGMLLYSIFTTL